MSGGGQKSVSDMGLSEDQRGFVLSGMALLLILPAMLLSSFCLVMVKEGGETASLQAVADKVSYTGWHLENTVVMMEMYDMLITNATLGVLAQKCEASTGLLVTITRSDNIVTINVQDPRGVARYLSTLDLSEV